jgi:hypothetical protein
MRTLALLVSITLAATGAAFAQANAELSQVQTVYIMPMANGFDQYLANRLRSAGNVRVVTDMNKADAVFTDKIGVAFESRIQEIEDEAKEKEALSKPVAVTKEGETPASNRDFKFAPRMVSAIGRGRGTFFLVDRRSRMVLWSIYSKPKNMQPDTLNRNAAKVAEQFSNDFTGKKK